MIITFAWTTDAFLAGIKTVTRRDWSDRTFAQWCRAWDAKEDICDDCLAIAEQMHDAADIPIEGTAE
jgi:hypothetical protein